MDKIHICLMLKKVVNNVAGVISRLQKCLAFLVLRKFYRVFYMADNGEVLLYS